MSVHDRNHVQRVLVENATTCLSTTHVNILMSIQSLTLATTRTFVNGVGYFFLEVIQDTVLSNYRKP